MNASAAAGRLSQDLANLDTETLAFVLADWQVWARDDQLPPQTTAHGGDWRVWLILGGRGAGKTRAGAEWVRAKALGIPALGVEPARRIALVGETLSDVRRVMIEGVSGLLAIHRDDERPDFESSKSQLVWPNGAVAQMFSAEDPDSLRGPQFDAAWCDELAKWRRPEETWDMLQFGMRLGTSPAIAVTTTPRPLPLLKTIMNDPATVITRAATSANAAHLAPTFIAEMERRYAGTALGRQELLGEIVDERSGSLWRRDWIESNRVGQCPELTSIVVAVDPPVTATARSDACGIIVAGLGADGRAYIAADRSLQGREPQVWARAAVRAYQEFLADRVVAEVNQGGDLVTAVLRQIDETVPVRAVRATRGKWLRAEPVAALYAEGRVAHAGRFETLEQQMLTFGADGLSHGRSPDRVDALVWALTDLMIDRAAAPAIRQL
ncbi:terminase family protein [Hyphomicrobium sp. CS1GBMeth3]|uniref:DNA-packaging protein n=1 Tax=Hyphomicrobium sp. CS1GBMeth3 TaxID=1892845 RepID=UPI000930D8E6|nr:terminase family protein [Hyphomicrobium sp. CS1GBMeth3]